MSSPPVCPPLALCLPSLPLPRDAFAARFPGLRLWAPLCSGSLALLKCSVSPVTPPAGLRPIVFTAAHDQPFHAVLCWFVAPHSHPVMLLGEISTWTSQIWAHHWEPPAWPHGSLARWCPTGCRPSRPRPLMFPRHVLGWWPGGLLRSWGLITPTSKPRPQGQRRASGQCCRCPEVLGLLGT